MEISKEEQEYYDIVQGSLISEGLIGSLNELTYETVSNIGVKLLGKIPANLRWGLKKTYVKVNGLTESEDVQDDIRDYSVVKENAEEFVLGKLRRNVASSIELHKYISDFIGYEKKTSNLDLFEKIRLQGLLNKDLSQKIKVTDNPVYVGNFELNNIYETIGKMD